MWEVEGRGGSRASLCRALPSSWRSVVGGRPKPEACLVGEPNALERPWIQQGFPSLVPWLEDSLLSVGP